MAYSPNAPFSWTPSNSQISEEQYQKFYAIDRRLVSTLINSLGRNSFQAINVVAFLLWLERNRLGSEAVYKVNGWPIYLVDILADQVAALLEWLKNPVLVWERRGDISMIQELCSQDVGFVYLHQRRVEILRGKTEIVNEMVERAFRDRFPGVPVQRNVNANVPREHVDRNCNGFQTASVTAGPVQGPHQVQNYNHNGAGFEFRGRYVHDPRELRNLNFYGAGYGSTSGGPVPTPPELQRNVQAVRFPTDGTFIHVRQQLPNMNHNGLRFGTISEIDHGHQSHPATLNGGDTSGFGTVGGLVQVHPADVRFGPRMGYAGTNAEGNPGSSRRSEMMNIRDPIPEDELAQLLRGLNVREEETDVREDDRTVFLTFSRGYPITEPEIWGFFTRKFGNFIESIHFEEVSEGKQPLYARMVARNSSILPLICDVNIKTNYVINGKHVLAKKYVRKTNTPAPRSSSSTANPVPPNP